MAVPPQTAAPVLSTPDTHIFEDPTAPIDISSLPKLSDEQVHVTYEIERTVREIQQGRWKRIALQFPDEMLVDAPRVYEGLVRGLKRRRTEVATKEADSKDEVGDTSARLEKVSVSNEADSKEDTQAKGQKIFILADTSYGSCCVDEVAAEHVDADVVVHYGRSCLSPTARLSVIYVFTTRPLGLENIVRTFKDTYPDLEQKIILMTDIPYSSHIAELTQLLQKEGYSNIFETEIIHDPSSPLPNRTVPTEVQEDITRLREYQIFHVSHPPTALLLTLSSRAGVIHIYPTSSGDSTNISKALLASSTATLRRRYALLTSLSTVSIFGILINTLSVKNYLHVVEHVKEMIANAGKKSYTFVVGKVNAAKIANFSEIGGWVVIGCWESSLLESKEFYKPIITPFELSLALKGDSERVWTGEWTSDFQAVLATKDELRDRRGENGEDGEGDDAEYDSEEESAPPEFDLRTGRYVSHSRPMRVAPKKLSGSVPSASSQSLIKRANGDVIQIGGVASPGAEFLREKRTWQGLGSDFEIAYQEDGHAEESARIEEGRRGVARGYAVGDSDARR
ncbi:diphthamide biosynthesis protein [Rhizodiscina lignyota]|uniref:2-(3-amino-3-carboxypropyl)histidine synthase subunit 2 n=1 Tax=Rhizodiscina lignyota TaxID=1504668 RepID=A0A9P4M539_9PEZI|nr:diphthamide biosynthesis protein [Rhizodiscina lignyota]